MGELAVHGGASITSCSVPATSGFFDAVKTEAKEWMHAAQSIFADIRDFFCGVIQWLGKLVPSKFKTDFINPAVEKVTELFNKAAKPENPQQTSNAPSPHSANLHAPTAERQPQTSPNPQPAIPQSANLQVRTTEQQAQTNLALAEESIGADDYEDTMPTLPNHDIRVLVKEHLSRAKVSPSALKRNEANPARAEYNRIVLEVMAIQKGASKESIPQILAQEPGLQSGRALVGERRAKELLKPYIPLPPEEEPIQQTNPAPETAHKRLEQGVNASKEFCQKGMKSAGEQWSKGVGFLRSKLGE